MSPEVAAYLAKGGQIRRFEPGASGNPIQILEWMNMQGVPAKYIGHGKAKVGRATLDLKGLINRANEMRRAAGLEPFTVAPTNTKAHFCFSTQPRFRPWRPKALNDTDGQESA